MSTVTNAYQQYKKNSIETADPKELILMLYDGAIQFLNIAVDNMKSYKTYDLANDNIIKAQNIVTELMLSIDKEKGKELAENLFNLYAFMKKELLEANINKDVEKTKNIINYLLKLKDSWEKMDISKDKDFKLEENLTKVENISNNNNDNIYRGFAAEG
ncbi:MAG: flagellar export chaperone FliS [Spirochaetia bacterium]|nr:flagellar export chaperone FliS [Spirochaetia bacterium]